MENVNRESIAAKINALLSKTIENGATEAEAMMAMKKATDLMAKYEFNLTQAQLEAGGIDRVEIYTKNSANYFAGLKISVGVAKLCEVKCWRETMYDGRKVMFYFGLKPDIQMARWMHDSLSQWMVSEANRWWQLPENFKASTQISAGARAELKRSFVIGCGERITERMLEAVAIRNAERQADRASAAISTGTSLVPVETLKHDIVKKGLKDAGLSFKTARPVVATHAQAHGAGFIKGNEANWNKPIGNATSTLRLK